MLVPEVWEAVTSLFRDYGYRRLRSKARLKFLIKDWGAEKFRKVLEQEYLHRPLIDGPAPEPLKHPLDHVGVQRQKNGLNAVGVAPIAEPPSPKSQSQVTAPVASSIQAVNPFLAASAPAPVAAAPVAAPSARSPSFETMAPIRASVVAIFKPLKIKGMAAGSRSLNKPCQ